MKGLSKRKGSDNWQGRFRIPESLWKRRADLIGLGVADLGKSQEFTKSLETNDRDEAAKRYRLALDGWDGKMDAWAALLANGPIKLNYRQRVALAADYAKAFLSRHEDEPDDAPALPPLPDLPGDDAANRAVWVAMGPAERQAFKADLLAYRGAEEPRRTQLRLQLLQCHPNFAAAFARDLAWGLEGMHGADTTKALSARGLLVDAETRRLANLEMIDFMGEAQRGLEARRDGNYRLVERLEAAPAFLPPTPATDPAPALTLDMLIDHKARTQSVKDKTIRDTRSHVEKFVAFVGHGDARKVTREDVRKWRDALIAEGRLHPKTISDRYISAVKSVLAHGVKEFDLPTNVASSMKDHRAAPALGRSKGYTHDEAVTILTATFRGSTKAVSAPHRRAIFWVPWILAYTGLRVTEVTQFRARHLREDNGVPYLLITPEDGSTKGKDGGKAWMVALHEHLIEMGLLEFMRSFGDGPMFYEPYPAGTDLTALKSKSRAQDAGVRVGKWVTGEVGIAAPLGRPNHAWRHLLTTRSRRHDMNKEARDFMMGSGAGDAREGYGEWPPERLAKEINKLPRFPVKDTGWRPA